MTSRVETFWPMHKEWVRDIRNLSFEHRKSLKSGPRIKIFDGDSSVMEVPQSLFLATSTQPHLIQKPAGEIHLPLGTGAEPILSIGCWLIAICENSRASKLGPNYDTLSDLLICRAGRLLGMDQYVDHILRHYWWRFNNRSFGAAEIEIVLSVAMGPEDPFLRLISRKLAEYLLDRIIPDPENLRAYIDSIPLLERAVYRARIDLLDEAQRAYERAEAEKALASQHEEEAWLSDEQAKIKAERKKWDEERRERDAYKKGREQQRKAMWEERNRKDAELNRSLLEKISAGKKVVTREEAKYFERTRGKRCPYKIS